jgi:hypothetical protein
MIRHHLFFSVESVFCCFRSLPLALPTVYHNARNCYISAYDD